LTRATPRRAAPRALSPRQTESGAIMLYLADKYGGAGPLGCDTPEKRAVLARWVRPVEARS
jgi:glutathione S-transferase